jgi:hypothetical protein
VMLYFVFSTSWTVSGSSALCTHTKAQALKQRTSVSGSGLADRPDQLCYCVTWSAGSGLAKANLQATKHMTRRAGHHPQPGLARCSRYLKYLLKRLTPKVIARWVSWRQDLMQRLAGKRTCSDLDVVRGPDDGEERNRDR